LAAKRHSVTAWSRARPGHISFLSTRLVFLIPGGNSLAISNPGAEGTGGTGALPSTRKAESAPVEGLSLKPNSAGVYGLEPASREVRYAASHSLFAIGIIQLPTSLAKMISSPSSTRFIKS
jgi:hypothetical protein